MLSDWFKPEPGLITIFHWRTIGFSRSHFYLLARDTHFQFPPLQIANKWGEWSDYLNSFFRNQLGGFIYLHHRFLLEFFLETNLVDSFICITVMTYCCRVSHDSIGKDGLLSRQISGDKAGEDLRLRWTQARTRVGPGGFMRWTLQTNVCKMGRVEWVNRLSLYPSAWAAPLSVSEGFQSTGWFALDPRTWQAGRENHVHVEVAGLEWMSCVFVWSLLSSCANITILKKFLPFGHSSYCFCCAFRVVGFHAASVRMEFFGIRAVLQVALSRLIPHVCAK